MLAIISSSLSREADLHFHPNMKSLTIGTLILAIGSATAQVCGTFGYDNSGHDPSSSPAYTVDTNATTPQLCSSLCKSDSTCQSFAVGMGSCFLYAAPAENNFTPDTRHYPPTRSPYYFYDTSCEVTSSSPPVPHSGPICAVQGYDRGNPSPGPYGGENTRQSCIAACQARPGCTAYALENSFVHHRNTGCYYYTSLVDNFDANPVKDTSLGEAFYFYEMSCPMN